mgnify:CR=1 FL=1
MSRDTTHLQNLLSNLDAFNQDLPEGEQVSVNNLKSTFEALDKTLSETDGYKDQSEYWALETQILEAAKNGDVDSIIRILRDN